jgi:hypothetical protein
MFCFFVNSLSAQIYISTLDIFIAKDAQIYVEPANVDEETVFSSLADTNSQSVDIEQINKSSIPIFIDSAAEFFISENALCYISEESSATQVVQKEIKSFAEDSENVEKPEKPEKQITQSEKIHFSAVPHKKNGNTSFSNYIAVTASTNLPQTRLYAVASKNENIFPILAVLSVAVTDIEKKSTIDFPFSLFSRPPPLYK